MENVIYIDMILMLVSIKILVLLIITDVSNGALLAIEASTSFVMTSISINIGFIRGKKNGIRIKDMHQPYRQQ